MNFCLGQLAIITSPHPQNSSKNIKCRKPRKTPFWNQKRVGYGTGTRVCDCCGRARLEIEIPEGILRTTSLLKASGHTTTYSSFWLLTANIAMTTTRILHLQGRYCVQRCAGKKRSGAVWVVKSYKTLRTVRKSGSIDGRGQLLAVSDEVVPSQAQCFCISC